MNERKGGGINFPPAALVRKRREGKGLSENERNKLAREGGSGGEQ